MTITEVHPVYQTAAAVAPRSIRALLRRLAGYPHEPARVAIERREDEFDFHVLDDVACFRVARR